MGMFVKITIVTSFLWRLVCSIMIANAKCILNALTLRDDPGQPSEICAIIPTCSDVGYPKTVHHPERCSQDGGSVEEEIDV